MVKEKPGNECNDPYKEKGKQTANKQSEKLKEEKLGIRKVILGKFVGKTSVKYTHQDKKRNDMIKIFRAKKTENSKITRSLLFLQNNKTSGEIYSKLDVILEIWVVDGIISLGVPG